MAYKKRNYKKSNTHFSKLAKGVGALGLAVEAIKGVRAIKRTLNPEKKFLNTVITSTAVSTTATTYDLCAIAGGSTATSRDGLSIKCDGLNLRYSLIINTATDHTLVRVMVVKDKQQVGDSAPGMSDVLTSATAESNRKISTTGRFSVLYDRVHILSNDKQLAFGHTYISQDEHVRFNGTTASDIQKNGYYLLVVSNQATNTPTIIFDNMLYFYDN